MKNRVYIANEQTALPLTPALRGLLRRAVNRTLSMEGFGRPAEVSVLLTTKEKIHALNRQCRGVDRPTDVLSFPMDDEDYGDGECAVLGDIILCTEQAAEQAKALGQSTERELCFLCVHSMLHLLGYDHEAGEAEEREMIEKQKAVMAAVGRIPGEKSSEI